MALARRVAIDCWDQRRAAIVSATQVSPPELVSPDEVEALLEFIGHIGSRQLLFAPMGAGPECLGYVTLTRPEEAPPWSEDEVNAALEIGRDLGRAVLHARLFERERQVVEELQRLDRYKTDLIATISHELRNPLTSIIGHLEMLQMVETPPTAGRSLAAITRNTERLETLVEDLLLLSKVGDPNRPLIPVQVDLVAALHETVEMFDIQAEQRTVTLRVVDPAHPVVICGDRTELCRVLSNIIGNAVKYSPAGGTVTLTLIAGADQVIFECRDEGLGISPEDQEHLFTEFYRSPNPEALSLPGTGLGLTIVKRIIERHDGTIAVDSKLGEGSLFTVTLPAVPPA